MQFHVANVNVVVSGLMASILRSCHSECQRKCAILRCFNKSARQNSPCSACCHQIRDKIRPARAKYAKKRHFERAGRVFSRNCCWTGRAGPDFSRRLSQRPGLGGDAAPSTSPVVGVYYTKPSYSPSPQCWTLVSCNSPATQCRIRFCGRGVPSGAASATYLRCTRASRTGITKPPGARPGGGGAGDGNRTRL